MWEQMFLLMSQVYMNTWRPYRKHHVREDVISATVKGSVEKKKYLGKPKYNKGILNDAIPCGSLCLFSFFFSIMAAIAWLHLKGKYTRQSKEDAYKEEPFML